MIAATTPTGSRTISELPTSSSQAISSTRSVWDENVTDGSPAWIMRDSVSGMPSSVAIRTPSSSPRSASFAPIAPPAARARSGEVCDQESKAARAARTARSASSGVPSGTRPITSSVVGLITSIVPEPAGSTHSPPMKRRSRTRVPAAMADIRVSLGRLTAAVAGEAARIASPVRWARAMIVIIGLVPDEVGKALASPIHTPGVSCNSP